VYKNKVLPVMTLIGVLFMSTTVSANNWPSTASLNLLAANCSSAPNQAQELNRLKQEIATANSVSEARTLALAPTDDAIDALKNARTLMPFSDDLSIAETRLSDARLRIEAADSRDEIADEFSGMILAGLDNDRAAHVNVGKVGCDYSTGELIAIVVGLILGIIPGLILLIVLC
jgi:hypothetical protein